MGVLTVLLLQALVIGSTLRFSYNALKRKQMRLSYTAFGFFTVIFIGQTFVNAGMTMGVLPTKGLTILPFFQLWRVVDGGQFNYGGVITQD